MKKNFIIQNDQIIIYQRVLRVPRNEAKEIGLIKCFVYLGIIRA
jgi:hypothetical protein